MKNTGLLKVISIIFMVFGIISIIFSVIALIGSGAVAALLGGLGAMLLGASILSMVLSIVEVLAGKEGLAICKGAGNPAKAKLFAMIILVFAAVSALLNIIPIVATGTPAGMSIVTCIVSVILPLLYLMGLKQAN